MPFSLAFAATPFRTSAMVWKGSERHVLCTRVNEVRRYGCCAGKAPEYLEIVPRGLLHHQQMIGERKPALGGAVSLCTEASDAGQAGQGSGGRTRRIKRRDKIAGALLENAGTAPIGIFSEPEFEEGWQRAKGLEAMIANAAGEYPSDAIYGRAEARIPELCAERAIMFWRDGAELLRRGEVPGEGLKSELDDVLRLQVRHARCYTGLQAHEFIVLHARRACEDRCPDLRDCDTRICS